MTHGATPLSIAAEEGHIEVVRYLCLRGADMNIPIRCASPDVIGPDTDPVEWEGATPIFIAAYIGHFEVVKCLAECGANCEQVTRAGITPEMIARTQGNNAVCDWLGIW